MVGGVGRRARRRLPADAEGAEAHHARPALEGLRRSLVQAFCSVAGDARAEAGRAAVPARARRSRKTWRVFDAFLADLPPGARAAFEFRHASWFDDEVYERLRARNLALCIADSEKLSTPDRRDRGLRLLPTARRGLHAGGDRRVGRVIRAHEHDVARHLRLLQARRGGEGPGVREGVDRGVARLGRHGRRAGGLCWRLRRAATEPAGSAVGSDMHDLLPLQPPASSLVPPLPASLASRPPPAPSRQPSNPSSAVPPCKAHDQPFRPVPVISVLRCADERAVSAVLRDPDGDVRVAGDGRIAQNGSGGTNGSSAAVRIERRHADAIDDAQRRWRGSSSRWRRRTRRAARCTPRRTGGRCGCADSGSSEKRSGKRRDLPPHPRLQVPHEVPLVERVLGRSSASTHAWQIHHRRDRDRRPRSAGGACVAVIAGELQREVAAERVARDDDAIDARRGRRARGARPSASRREAGVVERVDRCSVPPQLRWFSRTTLKPARERLVAMPRM